MTLRDALHAIFRRRMLMLLVPLAAVAAVLLVMLAQPERYESHARFMLLPWPSAAAETAFSAATGQRARADARDLETELRLLEGYRLPEQKSAQLVQLIHRARVDNAGPIARTFGSDSPDFSELNDRWDAMTRFERIPGTDLLEARFAWEEPYVALALAEAFVKSYVDHREGIGAQAPAAIVPAVATGPQAGFSWDEELHAIDAQLAELELKSQHVERQAKKRGWIDTPDLGSGASDLTRLDSLYFELRSERDRLVQLYQNDARAVVEVDSRLASLRRQKLASVRSILDLRAKSLADGRQRIAARSQQWAEASGSATPAVSAGATSGSLPPLALVVKPTIPQRPAGRVDFGTLLWVAVAAFLGAVLLALLMQRLDQKLTRAEDLEEAAGVPVLATIPTRKGV
jgi:hypothetical protein